MTPPLLFLCGLLLPPQPLPWQTTARARALQPSACLVSRGLCPQPLDLAELERAYNTSGGQSVREAAQRLNTSTILARYWLNELGQPLRASDSKGAQADGALLRQIEDGLAQGCRPTMKVLAETHGLSVGGVQNRLRKLLGAEEMSRSAPSETQTQQPRWRAEG